MRERRLVRDFTVDWSSRRLAYLVGIAVATPAMAVTWAFEHSDDHVLRWAYPAAAVALLAAGLGILLWPAAVLLVERITLFVASTLWLARLASQSYADGPPRRAWELLTPWAFMGICLITLFAYIVLDSRRALLVSASFATSAAVVLASRFVSSAVADGDWTLVVSLLRYETYLAITLAFVHLLARTKDGAVAAELEAERMRTMAYRDPLTGLPNRRALSELLDREVDHARRTPLSVIAFDLDEFKRVNDTLGHAAGDLVLQAAGLTMQSQLRAGDTAGRWGGEEFLVVAPGSTFDEAGELAERLRRSLELNLRVDGITITASFGVAQYSAGMSVATLLARADQLMYQAKLGGRNRVASTAWVPRSRAPEQVDLTGDLGASAVERLDQGA